MINLNSFVDSSSDVSIFNDGIAGKVNNVSVSIVKKQASDNANSPDYKIFYKDGKGEVNDGIYYPQESDTNPGFALQRLIHVLNAVDPATVGVEMPTFPDYKTATDYLMKAIHAGASKGGKVNVFVNYGTEGYPKAYLTVRKINFIEHATKEEITSRLTPTNNTDPSKSMYNDLMVRPKADNATSKDIFSDDGEVDDVEDEDFFV